MDCPNMKFYESDQSEKMKQLMDTGSQAEDRTLQLLIAGSYNSVSKGDSEDMVEQLNI